MRRATLAIFPFPLQDHLPELCALLVYACAGEWMHFSIEALLLMNDLLRELVG